MTIALIVAAIIVVGWLWLRQHEKEVKKSKDEFNESMQRQYAKNRQASEAATAFLERVNALALNLKIVARGRGGEEVARGELGKSIDEFARRAARGGWATGFAGMAECIATVDAVVIFSKSNALGFLRRERPSELGAVQRTYVRIGNDAWAFYDEGLMASEVDRAVQLAMTGQFTRVLSAAPGHP